MAGTYKAVKASPPDLAKLVIEAHGGLERRKPLQHRFSPRNQRWCVLGCQG